MKRDNDYIREFLLETEQDNRHIILAVLTLSSDEAAEKRYYHAELLCDAGLFVRTSSGVYRMTNQGHDYLEAIRNEGIWEQTKEYVAGSGGSATLEIFKDLATGLLRKKIEQHTGMVL